jgi:hypothetical protein
MPMTLWRTSEQIQSKYCRLQYQNTVVCLNKTVCQCVHLCININQISAMTHIVYSTATKYSPQTICLFVEIVLISCNLCNIICTSLQGKLFIYGNGIDLDLLKARHKGLQGQCLHWWTVCYRKCIHITICTS